MGAHTVPLHPDATAAIVALIFFFGVVCLGCLWALLLRHCRRALRALPPTPGLPLWSDGLPPPWQSPWRARAGFDRAPGFHHE